MYIFTGLLRGIRIVTTHSSLHTRSYPLDYIGFAGSGIRELVHSYVGKYVVCNMRATSGAYFFLRFYSTLHPPLYSSRCFLRWKFFALKEGFYTKKKKKKITKERYLVCQPLWRIVVNVAEGTGLKLFYVIFFV